MFRRDFVGIRQSLPSIHSIQNLLNNKMIEQSFVKTIVPLRKILFFFNRSIKNTLFKIFTYYKYFLLLLLIWRMWK